jgi:hypothetical protein
MSFGGNGQPAQSGEVCRLVVGRASSWGSGFLYLLGSENDSGLLVVPSLFLGPPLGAYPGVQFYVKNPKAVPLATLGSALLWDGIFLAALIVATFIWDHMPDWIFAIGILVSALGAFGAHEQATAVLVERSIHAGIIRFTPP